MKKKNKYKIKKNMTEKKDKEISSITTVFKARKMFKTIGEVKYQVDFPEEWIMTQKFDAPYGIPDMTGTGPVYCANCEYHGTNKEGVFLGYCLNCADYVYNGERGPGYSEGAPGEEVLDE